MSCHDIGRGMASVGREVLRLYDEGRYDKDTAIQLIRATLKGVNWCDGNSYEAAASLSCRCAHCFRKVNTPKDDLVFGSRFFAEESEVYDYEELESEDAAFVHLLYMDDKLLAPQVCHDCLRLLQQETT